MTTDPSIIPESQHPEARQKGLVIQADLGPYHDIPEQVEPILAQDGTAMWAPETLERLRSRKAWRKQGRYIQSGTTPRRTLPMTDGGHTKLFAFAQSLSEKAHRKIQQEQLDGRVQKWLKRWQKLELRMVAWGDALPEKEPVDAEMDLQPILNNFRQEKQRFVSLKDSLLRFDAHLDPPSMATWEKTLERYRARRFEVLIAETPDQDMELAQEANHTLVQDELARRDPLFLMPYWTFFGRFHKALEVVRFTQSVNDATRIHEFHALFPARKMQRRFTLYLGPTNSGKTYQSLQRLAKAESGSYLAPLRLLALEVSETLNEWGILCNLVTGEERRMVEGAHHSASTIEMLSLSTRYDLCVIDEAQMLGDTDRGWAWTQAILGVQAKEVCVIAAPQALPILKTLLKLTGDPYEIVELERLTPLEIKRQPVKEFQHLEPGTALIAFSRMGVLNLKDQIERATGEKAAVLYGALPPEIRRQQAALFASGKAPYLAASDAIGMGLNLPIRTLLFTQDRKFYNNQEHMLDPMSVRQIAGRAGRYGKNEQGYVGTFGIPLKQIRQGMQTEPK
ncbi:MAG: hypothetical protein HQL53_07545, partial [Magnetococcales bacterium]|nr:hypothetical protein [Magnetococcales bacterium]